MIDFNMINRRIEKEKETRYGISLVDRQFIYEIKIFEELVQVLKEKYFIKISLNPHITLFRCKSSNSFVNATYELNTIFESLAEDLNNIILVYKSISLDNDGVIRVKHKSNIYIKRREICSGLELTLVQEPWITLGRIWDVSNLELNFIHIKKIIEEYKVNYYIYKPHTLEMVLFKDILFENIITIKKYRINVGEDDEVKKH